jgi:hypothetical protein
MLRPSLVLFGMAVALVAGGGVLAFAGWTSQTESDTFTIQAARIPQVPPPTVTVRLVPVVKWKRVRIAVDKPVDRYIVTRHVGKATRVVCTLAATVPLTCLDLTAPPGSALTYTVQATQGEHWVGVDSQPSAPLTTSGGLVMLDASGEPVPGPSAAGLSSAPAVVDDDGVNPLMVETTPAPGGPTSSGFTGPTTHAPPPTATATTPAPAPTENSVTSVPLLPPSLIAWPG